MALTKCLFVVSQLALLVASVRAAPAAGGVSCLDLNGKPVDWWVVYKLPTVTNDPTSNDGFGFAYTDGKTPLAVQKGKSLKDETNALGNTLNQLYDSKSDSIGHIMWNDETSTGKTTSSQAHAKGVMIFDPKGGLLLRHSIPRYPNVKSASYAGLPDFTKIYGQTLMCVSVDLATLNNLAGQYLIAHPLVYDSKIPAELAPKLANVTELEASTIAKATMGVLEFKTTGGTPMTDLVKSAKCACDLWDAVVSPYYKKSMSVLTWGRPQQASGCKLKSNLNVENIQELAWPGTDLKYKETNEHSKWGITTDKSTLCIGDINRMTSQRKRGGGTICFAAPQQAAAFAALSTKGEAC